MESMEDNSIKVKSAIKQIESFNQQDIMELLQNQSQLRKELNNSIQNSSADIKEYTTKFKILINKINTWKSLVEDKIYKSKHVDKWNSRIKPGDNVIYLNKETDETIQLLENQIKNLNHLERLRDDIKRTLPKIEEAIDDYKIKTKEKLDEENKKKEDERILKEKQRREKRNSKRQERILTCKDDLDYWNKLEFKLKNSVFFGCQFDVLISIFCDFVREDDENSFVVTKDEDQKLKVNQAYNILSNIFSISTNNVIYEPMLPWKFSTYYQSNEDPNREVVCLAISNKIKELSIKELPSDQINLKFGEIIVNENDMNYTIASRIIKEKLFVNSQGLSTISQVDNRVKLNVPMDAIENKFDLNMETIPVDTNSLRMKLNEDKNMSIDGISPIVTFELNNTKRLHKPAQLTISLDNIGTKSNTNTTIKIATKECIDSFDIFDKNPWEVNENIKIDINDINVSVSINELQNKKYVAFRQNSNLPENKSNQEINNIMKYIDMDFKKREMLFILNQDSQNTQKICCCCCIPAKSKEALEVLSNNGYSYLSYNEENEENKPISSVLNVSEQDIIIVRCKSNIVFEDNEEVKRILYCSGLINRIEFKVKVKDTNAQKKKKKYSGEIRFSKYKDMDENEEVLLWRKEVILNIPKRIVDIVDKKYLDNLSNKIVDDSWLQLMTYLKVPENIIDQINGTDNEDIQSKVKKGLYNWIDNTQLKTDKDSVLLNALKKYRQDLADDLEKAMEE